MARVNFEESAIAAARKIARETGGNPFEIMGRLVCLWRESQVLEVVEASQTDLNSWLGFRRTSPKTRELVLKLVECGFLSVNKDSPDKFLISGNLKHIENLKQRKVAAKKGGEASAGKRTLEPNAPTKRLNPIQCSAEQSSNTTTTISKTQIQEAWEIWRGTLKTFGADPGLPLNAVSENSIARAIMQLGFEQVCLALEGQRYEAPGKGFNPRDHLSIDRVLHRDKQGVSRWEKFVNLAAAEHEKTAMLENAKRDAEAIA